MDTSKILKSILECPALPPGVKVSLISVEGLYARFILVFPEKKFRTDQDFRGFFQRNQKNMTRGLARSTNGLTFSLEMIPSDRPFTVFVSVEAIPVEEKNNIRSSTLDTFRYFKLKATLHLRHKGILKVFSAGDNLGWKYDPNGNAVVIRSVLTPNPVYRLALSDKLSKWMSSQDEDFQSVIKKQPEPKDKE